MMAPHTYWLRGAYLSSFRGGGSSGGELRGQTQWGHTFACFDSKWSFMLLRSGTCSMSIGIVIAQ